MSNVQLVKDYDAATRHDLACAAIDGPPPADESPISTAGCYPLKITSAKYGLRPQATLSKDEDLEFMVTEIEIRPTVRTFCEQYSHSQACSNGWYTRSQEAKPGWVQNCVACVFGCTAQGYSVCVFVNDCRPFVYIRADNANIAGLQRTLAADLGGVNPAYVQIEALQREHYYSWEPDPNDVNKSRQYVYLKISVPNCAMLRKLIRLVQNNPFKYGAQGLAEYDTRDDIIQQKFSVDSDVLPCRWVKVRADRLGSCLPKGYATHCQIELWASKNDLEFVPDNMGIPPLLMVSIDGEMYGSRDFPNAHRDPDACIGIGLTFKRFGSDDWKRLYLALHKPGWHPDNRAYVRDSDTIEWFDDERDLLEAYRDLLVVHGDVDMVLGYNTKGFDYDYWHTRMTLLCNRSGQSSRFFRQSRFIADWSKIKQSGITTGAKGENKYKHVPMAGRVQYDMYRYVKDDYKKLSDNTLKNVAQKLLPSERKEDLSPEQLMAIWQRHLCDNVADFNMYHVYGCVCVALQFHDPAVVDKDVLETVKTILEAEVHKLPESAAIKNDASLTAKQRRKKQRLLWKRFLQERRPFQDTPSLFMASLKPLIEALVSVELYIVAKYCIQDCDVVLHLEDYFANVVRDTEMTRVTFTSIEKLITKGQQIKIYNQLLYYGNQWGFIINDPPPELLEEHDKYDGAIVLDPLSGFYTVPIAILDFASLYPSIMRQHNLSPNTEVFNDAFKNLPGVTYTKRTLRDGREVVFVTHIKGIHPKLLDHLLSARKQAKFLMGQHDAALRTIEVVVDVLTNGIDAALLNPNDTLQSGLVAHRDHPSGLLVDVLAQLSNLVFIVGSEDAAFDFLQAVRYGDTQDACDALQQHVGHHAKKKKQYDAAQLALKIAANSIYGFNGVPAYKKQDPDDNGPPRRMAMLPCIDVAETVTHIGREMINQTKALTEKHFDSTVVYGDSVAASTPVLIRLDGVILLWRIDELPVHQWLTSGNKQYGQPRGSLEVWSEHGFTPVKRVIRHKTDKPLLQVITPAGCVRVTEDHSLLRPDGAVVKPSQCAVGDPLMTAALPGCTGTIPCPLAWLWGVFSRGGHCDDKWHLDWPFRTVLDKARQMLFQLYPECEFTINKIDEFHFRLCLTAAPPRWTWTWTDVEGKVPNILWSADSQSRLAFLNGYLGDFEDIVDGTMLCSDSELGAAGLYWLAVSLGHHVHILFDQGVYILTLRTQEGPSGVLVELSPTTPDGRVYDLETENHHFAAGVGQLVVHNTDSVMVKFHGVTNVPAAFDKGRKAAQFVTDSFGDYIELELENVAMPYLMLDRKKHYCKRVWMKPDKPEPNLDIKGIKAKRRDAPPFVAKAIVGCLKALMQADEATRDSCVYNAVTTVVKELSNVLHDRIPVEQYIMSKSMKDPSSYQNDRNAQCQIYLKKKTRKPGSEPSAGDRVNYMVLQGTAKGKKMFECVEDPDYVLENDMEDHIDRKYYVDHYLRKTIIKLLTHCTPGPPEAIFTDFDKEIASRQVCDNHQLPNAAREREMDLPYPVFQPKKISLPDHKITDYLAASEAPVKPVRTRPPPAPSAQPSLNMSMLDYCNAIREQNMPDKPSRKRRRRR